MIEMLLQTLQNMQITVTTKTNNKLIASKIQKLIKTVASSILQHVRVSKQVNQVK